MYLFVTTWLYKVRRAMFKPSLIFPSTSKKKILHVDVSLEKTLYPKLLLQAVPAEKEWE